MSEQTEDGCHQDEFSKHFPCCYSSENEIYEWLTLGLALGKRFSTELDMCRLSPGYKYPTRYTTIHYRQHSSYLFYCEMLIGLMVMICVVDRSVPSLQVISMVRDLISSSVCNAKQVSVLGDGS